MEPISGDTGDGYWVYHGLPYIAWHQDVARGVESAKIMDGMEMDGRVVALDNYVDLFSFYVLSMFSKKEWFNTMQFLHCTYRYLFGHPRESLPSFLQLVP